MISKMELRGYARHLNSVLNNSRMVRKSHSLILSESHKFSIQNYTHLLNPLFLGEFSYSLISR